MNFLHPWALGAGAAALSLPLVIHWLTRPRPMRLPLSTMRFVYEVIQQRRALHRLRNLIILLLRILAIALLAWAFARPLLGRRPSLADEAGARATRVVIVDVSQSMAAGQRGIESFERARPLAAEHLSYRPGLEANLILAGAQARPVFERASTNFAELRTALEEASPRAESLNIQAAVTAAAETLARSPEDAKRELVVVSDFQRSNFAAADFSPLPEDTIIQLESVAGETPPPNLGIVRAGVQGRAELNREVRFEVEVGNYSDTPRKVEVELALGDASYRLEGLCPPATTATLSTPMTPRAPGWQTGQARLLGVEDALPADDSRPAVMYVHPAPVYALITREPATPMVCSSYFVARALVPFDERSVSSDAEQLRRVDPEGVTREALADADLIVLDHPGKLSSDAIGLIASLLRRGRAVLYVTAEEIDATNLALLAEAAGSDLQMPVDFMPVEPGQSRRDLFLVIDPRRRDSVFAMFGDQLAAAIDPLRFGGGLASRPREGGLADDIHGAFSDQSAGFVLTACGAGSLGVINADLAMSSLPRTPAFVPLMGEIVSRLLGQSRADETQACGEPMARYLPAAVSDLEGLTLHGAGESDAKAGELKEDGVWILWRSSGLNAPGVYEVRREGTTVFALSAATPGVESDLSALASTVLQDRLAGGRTVYFHSALIADEEQQDAWAWFVVACVGCMLMELLALKLLKT